MKSLLKQPTAIEKKRVRLEAACQRARVWQAEYGADYMRAERRYRRACDAVDEADARLLEFLKADWRRRYGKSAFERIDDANDEIADLFEGKE